MKISIIVPIYGVEKYIERCAISLFEQSYDDIEYIFVNDCTTDNSIEILNRVINQYENRQKQVTIINHDVNMGLGQSRLTGINASTGEYIMIVDSDDYISTDAIEALVSQLKTTDADIIDGGYEIVANGKSQSSHMPYHGDKDKYLKLILCQNIVPNVVWGRLIKRELFTLHNISFVRGIDYGEDFLVFPRLLYYAYRSHVDKVIYHYNNDNSSSYTNNITTRNAISFLKANNEVYNFFSQVDDSKNYTKAVSIGITNVYRFARRFNVDRALLDEHFNLKPKGAIMRLCKKLYQSPFPIVITDFIYRLTRRITIS